MRYAICNKQEAISAGINTDTHRCNEKMILLNEKEVMVNKTLKGKTFEERITTELDGRKISEQAAIDELNKGDWK